MLRRYVKVKFSGDLPERFLNMCKHKQIKIWDLKENLQEYECYLFAKDFRKLKSIVKKTNIKIRIIEKHGILFQLFRYQNRKMYILGIAVCICILIYTTQRIWDIEFQGNFSLTYDILYDYLAENNIRIGTKRSAINCKEICKMLRRDYEEIIWVSASLEGTSLKITIKEKMDLVEDNKDETRNLVSNLDGTIVSMITRKGIPIVKEGDVIQKGDLLVSGTIELKNDAGEIISEQKVRADADIYVKHIIHYRDSCSNTYQEKKYMKEKKYSISVQLWTYYLELGFQKQNVLQDIRCVCLYSAPFVSIEEKIKQEYVLEDKKYEENDQKAILKSAYNTYIENLKKENTEIVSENIEYFPTPTEMICSASIEVIQQVVDLY